MKIGTANIKNYPDMPKKKVQADGKEISSLTDIWGMQENNPTEDLPAIMEVLGPEWETMHEGTNVPIYYRKDKLKVISTDKTSAPFEPVLALTPRPRWITGAVFELKERAGVPNFAIVNCHLIAGGMNGPKLAPRARQWGVEFTTLGEFITSFRKKGLTTFVLGDFNSPRPPKPVGNFTWLVGNRLDRIGVTNTGSVEVDETNDGVVDLNSDHNAQWTQVILSKASKSN
jgi:hypothetical protein